MLSALVHDRDTGWKRLDDLASISDEIEAGRLLWAAADINALMPGDIDTITEEFGLHSLAVEDALNARQRPKTEIYDNHLFSVFHQLDEVDEQLEARQVACFIGKNFVLTLHDRSSRTLEQAIARCSRTERAPGRGPSWIMHALVDTIVDEYQHIADGLEEQVEALEDQLLIDPAHASSRGVYSIKQRLARLRRYALPGSRTLATFVETNEASPAGRETALFFRDVLDHLMRITDQVRNVDDLLDALLELRRSEQSNALNEVTKKLTAWAAIIAVPTFIASFYGMNVALTPATGSRNGFWVALGAMMASAGALYLYFKRKNWV